MTSPPSLYVHRAIATHPRFNPPFPVVITAPVSRSHSMAISARSGLSWFRGMARITSGSLLGQECRVVITHPLCRPLPWMTGSLTAMNPGVEATMVLD